MEFKKRISKHKTDFTYKKYKESTKLSNYIWKLKEKKTNYEINWKVLRKVKKNRNGDKICKLCMHEIMAILKNKDHPLNSRNEIMNTCRHKKQFLLKNWKRKQKQDQTRKNKK